MKTVLHSLLPVAGAWIVLTATYLGIGLAVCRCAGLRSPRRRGVLLAPWVGWAASIMFLQCWHCFLPVDWRPALIVLIAGSVGLAWQAGCLIPRDMTRGSVLRIVTIGLVLSLWLANQTTNQPGNGDSSAYHLTSTRWICDYPIVPGLANVYAKLGFNSSYFLYVAMLDTGLFAQKSHQLASGLLIMWLLARPLLALPRLLRRNDTADWETVSDALWLAPSLMLVFDGLYVNSPTPDVAVFALGIVIGSEMLRLSCRRSSPPCDAQLQAGGESWRVTDDRHVGFSFFCIALLSAVGVTMKLSFVAFGFLASLAGLIRLWQEHGKSRRAVISLFAAFAAALFAMGLWAARGVVTSGYPAFPSTFAAFPVDWRVPGHLAHNEALWVRSWARVPGAQPDEVTGVLAWIWPWLNRMCRRYSFEFVLPLALAVLSFLLWRLRIRGRESGHGSPVWLMSAVLLPSLAFWFCQAPEPRFAGNLLWLTAIVPLTAFMLTVERRARGHVVLLLCAVLCLGRFNFLESFDRFNKDPGTVRRVAMSVRTTDSGLRVYTPGEGEHQCWDGPLPCTPHFNPNLRLRVEGDMSKGFAVHGTSACLTR